MLKILANKHAVVLTAALLMSGFAALPVCAGQTNAAQNADEFSGQISSPYAENAERSVFCAGRHSVQRADAGADGRFRPDERIR